MNKNSYFFTPKFISQSSQNLIAFTPNFMNESKLYIYITSNNNFLYFSLASLFSFFSPLSLFFFFRLQTLEDIDKIRKTIVSIFLNNFDIFNKNNFDE